jgi:hypothetical protein
MHTLTRSITCPTCGHSATITLFEDVDPVRGSEGHQIKLQCSNPERHPEPSEVEKLRVWALNHADRERGAR